MRVKFKPFLGSGDNGWTDLLCGRRVPKTDLRIRINALIDELNCLLEVIKDKKRTSETAKQRESGSSLTRDKKIKNEINGIQKDLILISASIAGLKADETTKQATSGLEEKISNISRNLPMIKKFIIPGKTETESLIHLVRSRARIIEILLWKAKLKKQAIYFNRLSDYLFLMARQKYH
jgi:cob(I)alamin adenosyltransferase